MTKKEYLVKLMESLSSEVLPIAPHLLRLLQRDKIGEALIDTLYGLFHEYALTIKDSKHKEKIDASLSFLQKLKSAEGEDQLKNQKDIEDLETMLQNI